MSLFWTRVWFGPHEPGWFNFWDTAARRFAIFWPMVLIFSTTGSAFMSLCVLGCWLLSGRFAEKLRVICGNPVAIASLAISLLSLIGCLYSTANQTDLLKSLENESNFLIIAVCITLFDKDFYRDAAIAIFHGGAVVLICYKIVLYAMYSAEAASMLIVDYVTFGLIVVAWILLILYRPFSWKRLWPAGGRDQSSGSVVVSGDPVEESVFPFRLELKPSIVARLILVLLLILFLLGVNPGRTVYICLIAVLGISVVRSFQWKAIATGVAAVVVLLLISTVCFPIFRTRCMKAYREAVEFHTNDNFYSSGEESSIGNRLFMYKYGLRIVALHPVFGTGTGSIATEYDKQIADFNRNRQLKWPYRIGDPHCEWLIMTIQFGVVGLIAWIAWLGTLWYYSSRIVWPWSLLGRFMATMITISTLFSSHMSNVRTGCFYALMVALFFSAEARSSKKEPR